MRFFDLLGWPIITLADWIGRKMDASEQRLLARRVAQEQARIAELERRDKDQKAI